jgi:hypothetical protein
MKQIIRKKFKKEEIEDMEDFFRETFPLFMYIPEELKEVEVFIEKKRRPSHYNDLLQRHTLQRYIYF